MDSRTQQAVTREFPLLTVASVVGDKILVEPALVKELLGFLANEDADKFWGLSNALLFVRSVAVRWLLSCFPELERLQAYPAAGYTEEFVAGLGLPETFSLAPKPTDF